MKDQDICIVSRRIRERRKQLGLTQAALAEKLDVNTKTIVTIEQMAVPTFATDRFISLCTILDCSPDYLMGIDDLPHRVSTDIHAAIGLSELAIDTLISSKNFVEGMKKKGYSFRTYEEEIPQFISFLITTMNGYLIFKHIETGARAKVLDKRYAEKELEYEELIQVIKHQEEFLNDMLNDEKWETLDITIPSEENLIFRKMLCENAESSNRSKIHSMLKNLYDAYADQRIDEECVTLEKEERMV